MGVLVGSSLNSFLQLMVVLLIFLFVLAITYFTTKWMSGIQKGRLAGKNISVIETIPLGNGKMICLVQAGITYLVVSVGKDEVHLLTKLTKEELSDVSFLEDGVSDFSTESFQEVLKKIKNKMPKGQV